MNDAIEVQLRELVESAAQATLDAKKKLQKEQAVERLLAALLDATSQGNDTKTWQTLKKSKRAVELLRNRDHKTAELLHNLGTRAEARLRQAIGAMPGELPARLAAVGLQLDSTSRHPRYTVHRQLISLTVDSSNYEAVLRVRHGAKRTLPLNLGTIADALAGESRRLFDRPFDAVATLKRISDAFERSLSASGKASGPVKYRDLVAHLAEDQGFAEDEFVVDLSRLVRGQYGGGKHVRLLPTKEPKNGVLVPGLEDRGYFGFLEVLPESS
jgi:hypothetical protein